MARAEHCLVHQVIVRYDGEHPLEDAEMVLEHTPRFAQRSSLKLGTLMPGALLRIESRDLTTPLDEEFLRAQKKEVQGAIECSIIDAHGQTLKRVSAPLRLLSVTQWSGWPTSPELLVEFVRPDAVTLDPLIKSVEQRYHQLYDVALPDAYANKNILEAEQITRVIYDVIKDSRLSLVKSAARFDEPCVLRAANNLLEDQGLNIIEVTALVASLLERCALNPLILLSEDIAVVGVWLKDYTYPSTWVDDIRPFVKHSDDSEMMLFNAAWALSARTFEQARYEAEGLMALQSTFLFGLDVKSARMQRDDADPSGQTWPSEEGAMSALDKWKEHLLDLSLRNRLLNYKESKKVLPLVTTDLALLEDHLICEGGLSLLPRPKKGSLEIALETYANQRLDEDIKAITSLTVADFNKRAKELFRLSESMLRGAGSCPLYLALGMVRWFESERSEVERFAPILLVPVRLVRAQVGGPFKIKPADEDAMINVTLLKKFERDFGLDGSGFSLLPEDDNGVDVDLILQKFREYLRPMPRFEVQSRAAVSLFEFSKFLMWLDLEQNQDLLKQNSMVQYLLDQELEVPQVSEFSAPSQMDTTMRRRDDFSVMECDSSQLAAIASALDGNSFVLQGPPGTGKSQTITNLIAQALAQDKTVLFVSEKRAALEVVEARLSQVGLGAFTLEAHSEKASKKAVIRQLEAPFLHKWPSPTGSWDRLTSEIEQKRQTLNAHMDKTHEPGPFGESIFEAVSLLTSLRDVPFVPLPRLPKDLDEFNAWRTMTSETMRVLNGMESLLNHPWRLVQQDDWTASWQRQVEQTLSTAQQHGHTLERALSKLCEQVLRVTHPPALSAWATLVPALKALRSSPSPPAQMLERPHAQLDALIQELTRELQLHADERRAFMDTFKPTAKETLAVEQELAQLEKWAGSFFIIAFIMLFGTKRRIQPHLHDEASTSSDLLIKALRHTLAMVKGGDALDAKVHTQDLGMLWRGAQTSTTQLEATWTWCVSFRQHLIVLEDTLAPDVINTLKTLAVEATERLGEASPAKAVIDEFIDAVRQWDDSVSQLHQVLGVDSGLFASHITHHTRMEYIDACASHTASLKEWCRWIRTSQKARKTGLGPLIDHVERDELDASSLLKTLDRSVRQQWYEQQQEQDEALRYFRGTDHEETIKEFRALETKAKDAAVSRVQAKLAAKLPNPNAAGQMAILRQEFKKKSRHKSLRKLYREAPDVMRCIKPCVLMSPLSAAMFLDPSLDLFDMVIFDEASQIPPWDAIGALGRAKQAVVVGDSKQLPPTSFFSSASSSEDFMDEEHVDMESILDHCIAQGMRQLTLDWHYRSRHESLIAFSNKYYYNNRLNIFPAAASDVEELGVKWRHIPDGFYDRGGSRTNVAEARAIVAEVVSRLTSADPTIRNKSIGIVTFSSAQQRCVEDWLDVARQDNPQIERFFTQEVREPLFVKNLENVQGDERDIILFSVCYGPDAQGKITMNFGPLNREGGERRLNVAITRSRELLVVFSTLTPAHINLSSTASVGVHHFRTFLDYAKRGEVALKEAVSLQPDRAFDSPLEEEIAASIRLAGWEVHPQVGVAGYRIDLGIVDPQQPGSYILGVECDGASYHSSKTARDRDRIRQGVLEGLGWRIHRVWSTDWWQDRARQTDDIIAAIKLAQEDALLKMAPSALEPVSELACEPSQVITTVTREEVFLDDAAVSWPDYAVRWTGWPEMSNFGSKERFYNAASNRDVLSSLHAVTQRCAPISVDLAAKFVIYAWGFKSASSKALKRVLALVPEANLRVENETLWPRVVDAQAEPFFRYVPDGEEPRDFREIPNSELDSALLWIIAESVSLSQEEAARELARVFGSGRIGKAIKDVTRQTVQRLEAHQRITLDASGALTASP